MAKINSHIENSPRASTFRFDATLEAWVAFKDGYRAALLDMSDSTVTRASAEEFSEAFLQMAAAAAKERLAKCAAVLFEEEEADADGLAGPFCGCETCMVREVLSAAYPHLEAHFEYLIMSRLGFEIDWGNTN